MNEPFIGAIQYYAFSYAPRGWHACDGTLLQITQYQALFAVLGTYYGGDGRTTFGLPDLRGRTMIGAYVGGTITPGLTQYPMGAKSGVNTVALTAAALPQHTHTISGIKIAVNAQGASTAAPANMVPGAVTGTDGPGNVFAAGSTANAFLGAPNVTVNPAGGSQPFSNMNPYIGLNCCIALQGIFPSRN